MARVPGQLIDAANGEEMIAGFAGVEAEVRRIGGDPGDLDRDSPH